MPIVLITPPSTLPNEHILLERFFTAGLQKLHLRKPGAPKQVYLEYLGNIPEKYYNRIALHDHHDLVEELHLGGKHFPERVLPTKVSPDPKYSQSASFHDPEQLLVDRGPLDYCFLSPIYQSISKSGYGPPTAGKISDRKALAAYISQSKTPVIALGGVTPEKFSELADLGFWGAALLGNIWQAEDPLAALETALLIDSKTQWNNIK